MAYTRHPQWSLLPNIKQPKGRQTLSHDVKRLRETTCEARRSVTRLLSIPVTALPAPPAPDEEERVLPDLAGHVEEGIGTRWGKDRAWEESCLRRAACLLLLHLLKNVFVDGAPQQVLVTVHQPPGTLVHPVQFFFLFPGSRKGHVDTDTQNLSTKDG